MANADEMRVLDIYGDLLSDELNVKHIRSLGSVGEVVSYSLNPLPKQLGQKYKAKMPAVRAAILAVDTAEAAQELNQGRPLRVEVEGETLEVLPEEVEVRAIAHSGLTVASDGAYLCALSTELTPALVSEGLAREFVRRVQDLRKQADFDIADRIHLYYQASPRLAEAIEANCEYIMGETLSLEMMAAPAPEGSAALTAEFDGEQVAVGLAQVRPA